MEQIHDKELLNTSTRRLEGRGVVVDRILQSSVSLPVVGSDMRATMPPLAFFMTAFPGISLKM